MSHLKERYAGAGNTESLLSMLYPKFSKPNKSRFSDLFFEGGETRESISSCSSSTSSSSPSCSPVLSKSKSPLGLNPNAIESGLDQRTSIMIKNIPATINQNSIKNFITSTCQVDYLYIPKDNSSHKILGFAFVNVENPLDILTLEKEIKGNKIFSRGNKKIEICYSKMQGICSLIKAFGKEYLNLYIPSNSNH